MGCGCNQSKKQTPAEQKQSAQTQQVTRTPESRETYRRVLEEAAKKKPVPV